MPSLEKAVFELTSYSPLWEARVVRAEVSGQKRDPG
jgi:hypothetical protein